MIFSYSLSKKLTDMGVESTSGKAHVTHPDGQKMFMDVTKETGEANLLSAGYEVIPAPSLIDLIRQAEVVFGKHLICVCCGKEPYGSHVNAPAMAYKHHTHHITDMLMNKAKQEDIENYIISNLENNNE